MPFHGRETSNEATQYHRTSSTPAQASRAKPQDIATKGGGSWTWEAKLEVVRLFSEGHNFKYIGRMMDRSAVACRIIKCRFKEGTQEEKELIEQAELQRKRLYMQRKAEGSAAVEEDDDSVEEDDYSAEEDQATVDEDNSEEASPISINQISGTNNVERRSLIFDLRRWKAAVSLILLSGGREMSEDEMIARGIPQFLIGGRGS